MTERTDRSAIRQRYLEVDTATVCDVFDDMKVSPPALSPTLRRITCPGTKIAGWAYTIEGCMTVTSGPDRLKLEVVDSLPEDSVAIWAATNSEGVCQFGDLIAATMHGRGCRGAVVDGGVRDVSHVDRLGFPVVARYTTPVQSIGRWRVMRHAVGVTLPGALEPVAVHPDDFVLGDADGVVIIPARWVMEVLERAEALVKAEGEARDASGQGLGAADMLDKFGRV